MRRRHRPRPSGEPPGNLDSFLDIMMNTVGVMIFVLLFVTLSAAQASVLVPTPLVRPTQKLAIFFEADSQRIRMIDVDAVDTVMRKRLARNRAAIRRGALSVDEALTGTILAGDYLARWEGDAAAGRISFTYRPQPTGGTHIDSLNRSDSPFLARIATLDTGTAFVAFLVRPEGYPTFRKAREVAARRGLEIGWEPVERGRLIRFGSGGRTIGTQ